MGQTQNQTAETHKPSSGTSEELGNLGLKEARGQEKGKALESEWNPWETPEL